MKPWCGLVVSLFACATAGPEPSEHAGMAGMEASPGASTAAVEVAPDIAAALDIRTEPATSAEMALERRAPATVGWDPLEVVRVSAQPGGQVRELRLPRVGEQVRAGQLVARLYAPEVVAGFEELRVARGLGETWVAAARSRLIAGGVSAADVDQALSSGTVPQTYGVRARGAGVVLQRLAVEGDWVSPGGPIAVVGDTRDLVVDMVVTGAAPPERTVVTLRDTTTGDTWTAAVSSRLPTADAAGTQVRLVPDAELPVGRPLVAEWTEAAEAGGVWVPRTALVDTGTRRVVFVATAPGVYTPRTVTVGARGAGRVQLLTGVSAGEAVVVAGTFLLDSETQMGAVGHAGHGG